MSCSHSTAVSNRRLDEKNSLSPFEYLPQSFWPSFHSEGEKHLLNLHSLSLKLLEIYSIYSLFNCTLNLNVDLWKISLHIIDCMINIYSHYQFILMN